jgi:hypothetical protein
MRVSVTAVMVCAMALSAVARSEPMQRPGAATAPLPPAVSEAGAGPRAPLPPHASFGPETKTGSSVELRPAEGGGDEDVGLEGFAPVGCSPVYSGHTGNVGPATGAPEKDSYGAVVTGHTCP